MTFPLMTHSGSLWWVKYFKFASFQPIFEIRLNNILHPRSGWKLSISVTISTGLITQVHLVYTLCRTALGFRFLLPPFLGFSQKCEKRLLASSCLSGSPKGTIRLPMDGFSRNVLSVFRKSVENIQGCFTRRTIYIFYHISLHYA